MENELCDWSLSNQTAVQIFCKNNRLVLGEKNLYPCKLLYRHEEKGKQTRKPQG